MGVEGVGVGSVQCGVGVEDAGVTNAVWSVLALSAGNFTYVQHTS